MNLNLHSSGQTLIDGIIAMAIFTIMISATVAIFFNSQSSSLDATNFQKATDIARNGIEAVRSIKDSGWLNLTTGQHGLNFSNNTWSFNGTSDVTGEFTRVASVSDKAAEIRKVTVTVNWTANNKNQKVDLVQYFTNWQAVVATGNDTGGSPPSGDWLHPQTLGSLDLGPGEQATDLDVKNKIVYMTATASDKKKDDFFIVNATNGQNPVIVSSLDLGDGLNGIDAAGNYAYVVGSDDAKEFSIIDVSNISSPVKVSSLDLPGNADALTVFYRDRYAYIGRASGAPQEFLIIDVSNPSNPVVVSGLSNVGNEINEIYVLNQKAYLGTEDTSRGMIVVNVGNPNSPQILGSFNIGMHVYSIYLQNESKTFVGARTDFDTANASVPANITRLSSGVIGYRTRDIITSGTYAFLGTEDSNKEFQIWDVSDVDNIKFVNSFNFSQIATGIDYEDNLVYVSVRSNDALRIITSGP